MEYCEMTVISGGSQGQPLRKCLTHERQMWSADFFNGPYLRFDYDTGRVTDQLCVPAPGSDAALDAGCRCPVLDNGHGRGFPGGDGKTQYWVNAGCPMHSNPTWEFLSGANP